MSWLQTASGRCFDLLAPTPEMVDFIVDIPGALSRLARFTGHVEAGPYSVAQHSVLGADAVLRETSRPDLAVAFLLHDAHEAYIGDIATPIAQALAISVDAEGRGTINPAIPFQLAAMKTRVDAAIWRAAGLPWPRSAEITALIKVYDLRMLATERRHLLGPSPLPWGANVENAEPLPSLGKIKVWPWPRAADEFRERLDRYLPDIGRRCAA